MSIIFFIINLVHHDMNFTITEYMLKVSFLKTLEHYTYLPNQNTLVYYVLYLLLTLVNLP